MEKENKNFSQKLHTSFKSLSLSLSLSRACEFSRMKKASRKSSIGLKNGCNSAGTFSTRFSLQSFVKRIDKLTEKQKKAIERLGFGNLLNIHYQMLCKSLLVELMDRWSSEKRAFVLVTGDIRMTLMDVAVILGLRVTGDPVILREDEPFSDLERGYGATVWNRKISVATIEERLDSLDGIVNEDFIRSFLLFTFGTLLFPNANGKVDSRYLSILQKLDKVCHFAWGATVLEDIINWLCKRKEINVQYVGGCLIFLQIWSYEHIDIARPSLLDLPMVFPRACQWKNSRSRQRQWFTTKFKELEKNQITWNLQLTSEELKRDIIKELLLESQSDCRELPAPRYNVLIGKEDKVRTRIQIMDQWIAEMEIESETEIVKEVHGAQEDCSKQLRTAQNVPVMLTDNVKILPMSHQESEGQREQMENPSTSQDPSKIIILSDDDNEDNLGRKDQLLQEQNTKLKKEIDGLRKENKLLKDELLSSSALNEENAKLREEVENLRKENQNLILSSNSFVARLENIVSDENVNTTEYQSPMFLASGDSASSSGLVNN